MIRCRYLAVDVVIYNGLYLCMRYIPCASVCYGCANALAMPSVSTIMPHKPINVICSSSTAAPTIIVTIGCR